MKRHQPAKPTGRNLTSEIHLDVVSLTKRDLTLGAVDEKSRQSETEAPVESIIRAAGNDAGASEHGSGGG